MSRETRLGYGAPYRPAVVRFLNAAGDLLAGVGVQATLSPSSLVAAARSRTGLHDFGDEGFLLPLQVLVDAIEREARLHAVGRLITRERLVAALANRLRAHRLFTQRPEILTVPVAAPLVITGLQRTGSTMLHRLLAADPSARVLSSWEALTPAPLAPVPFAPGYDRRRAIAAVSERMLAYLAPDFFAVHPVEADAPEEESVLLDISMLSPVSDAMLQVPSYSRWLSRQDATPAYLYLADLLRLLQAQRPARRWVLKTPHHLGVLDVLLRVFPSAKVIQLHRDPSVTLASFCSMIAHGRGVFSDAVDPVGIGEEWLVKQHAMVTHATAVRDSVGDDRVMDVHYRDLMVDTMGQVERIYAFAGLELTDTVRGQMARAHKRNRQHRFGRHRYALETFGLQRGRVSDLFADYRRRYGIPREEAQGAESS